MHTLSAFTVLLMAITLTACDSSTPTTPTIVGTWEWISADDVAVPYEFFSRFYEDGIVVSWADPEHSEEGLSHDQYAIRNDQLVLLQDYGEDLVFAFELRGDEFVVVIDQWMVLVYRRLLFDLDPGELP